MASSCARSHDLHVHVIITSASKRIRSMKRKQIGLSEVWMRPKQHNDKNCGEPADDASASSTSLSESNSSKEARSVMCDKQLLLQSISNNESSFPSL